MSAKKKNGKKYPKPKRVTKIIRDNGVVSKKQVKAHDYGDELPNPYDKGMYGFKGNKKLLNRKIRKAYGDLDDQLKMADIEFLMGKDIK